MGHDPNCLIPYPRLEDLLQKSILKRDIEAVLERLPEYLEGDFSRK